MAEPDPLVAKATRLFTFLAKSQRLKERPIRDIEKYQRDGMVQWFSDLPTHPAVRWHDSAASSDQPILSIDRVDKVDPPEVPESIRRWVSGDVKVCEKRPILLSQITSVDQPDEYKDVNEHPQIRQQFDHWIAQWDTWASNEKESIPVRETYKAVYGAHVTSTQNAEENELVLAVGLLAWDHADYDQVRRHIFTVKVDVEIDSRTGRLDVDTDSEAIGLSAELDMLDPAVFPTRELPSLTEERAAQFSNHALDRVSLSELGSKTIFALDPEGQYLDEVGPLRPGTTPTISWSPALILRPRPRIGLAQAFEQIADDIEEAEVVPSGLRPLLDPGETPLTQPDPSPGALLPVDDEIFSPLPLNDVQRQILERVDRNAQTLVQGPPGTGKTHTAAALLTHLLAQGKRVLVTAHTDRALYEVRNKLPELIRPLAVSVIGASRSDMSQLRTAVDTISTKATEHDPDDANTVISQTLASVEDLRSQRQVLNERLINSREREITVHDHAMYSGTLASISQAHASDRNRYDWITDFIGPKSDLSERPTDDEAMEWLNYLRNTSLQGLAEHRHKRSVNVNELPTPEKYAVMANAQSNAETQAQTYLPLASHPAHEPLSRIQHEERLDFQSNLNSVVDLIKETSQLHAAWAENAIHDMRIGAARVWADRYRDISEQLKYVEARTNFLGFNSRFEAVGDADANMQLAKALREHITAGHEIKTQIDGTVKFGIFTSSIVKRCKPFLENVRVNGRAPTNLDLVDRFIAYQDSCWALERLDRSWPSGTEIPSEDTLNERVSWHRIQLQMLERVLDLRQQLNEIDNYVRNHSMPAINWSQLNNVVEYGTVVDAVAADEEHTAARSPLLSLQNQLDEIARWDDAADWIAPMQSAVESGDHRAYANAYGRAVDLANANRDLARADDLAQKMGSLSSDLSLAVRSDPSNSNWDNRLAQLNSAINWATTGMWLREQDSLDANDLQDEISRIEHEIQGAAEAVAAMRAWNHAVGKERLSLGSRADLTQYSQLVRKLGKGTGKYAAQQRAEIRESLDRCRPSVPVWIMPIYRVVEQLRISENMFDVVLIDEASQAGLEAAFLQYLAPKIVVIGDDKQVSPAAVGVDQQALRDLADQYLHDDRYKASWQDPARSLFDEARMRYGGQLTLTEHRRCVPEIIGFSNRIAYEPNGIRLVPVRQFGADRLEPFKVTRTADAYEEGRTGNKINKGEAAALVDAVLNCLDDPSYDGRTFGVISLLGNVQSKYLEGLLLDAVPADEWQNRQLQVGSPPDFQGSERDVIFLTMVSSAEPGTRLAPLTREMYVQRYNVAVSRAKDQIWLFHTLRTSDLTNEQDLRYQLLDYVYGVRQRGRELSIGETAFVPEDDRVEGFDSLFEQRVYNRIADRGFTVVPQFETQGYRIDLVVVGANGRLAIECDGDHWHGPDAYASDLARQRDLERCGWSFFRIRESVFYSDKAAALSPLWDLLTELEIRPAEFLNDTDETDNDDTLAQQAAEQQRGAVLNTDPFEESASSDTELFENHEVAESYLPIEAANHTPENNKLQSENFNVDVPLPPAPSPLTESMSEHLPSVHSLSSDLNDSEASIITYSGTDKLLTPYRSYQGYTRPVGEASRTEMIDGLEQIVDAEGPVTGTRLLRSYVLSSGGKRVGRAIAKELNAAITQATRSGRFISENPLNQPGNRPKTFRRAHQPIVELRALGTRTLDEVPPSEIAAAMQVVQERYGAISDDEIFRHTLWLFGRKSLTQPVRESLAPILEQLIRNDSMEQHRPSLL